MLSTTSSARRIAFAVASASMRPSSVATKKATALMLFPSAGPTYDLEHKPLQTARVLDQGDEVAAACP